MGWEFNTKQQLPRKNVVQIITGLAFGGAEKQVVEISTRLSRRGWKVAIISLLDPQIYLKELQEAGVSLISLHIRSKSPLACAKAFLHAFFFIRKYHPTIVHAHMFHANIFTRLLRLLRPWPVLICTAHNIDERGRKGTDKFRTFLYRVTDPLCDLTTQVSRAGLERYIRIGAVPKHKARYIPNGVDIHRFAPDPKVRENMRRGLGLENEFVWLAVGRFEPQKDYAIMLLAFAQVIKKYRDTCLLIAGDGPLRASMETLAKELGIEDYVRFLGARRDIPELMNAADGFALSSMWEGMPMVLLEAHAVGLPIVATDVGGNREIVLHGKTGFLVQPKTPNALAQAMLRLMELPPDERQKMGQAGRKHVVENFSIEHVVNIWEALYRELSVQKGIKIE